MKAAILGIFIVGIFYANPLLAQVEASSELIEAASQGSMGILQRGQTQSSTPIVCADGTWNHSLGCCAKPSGACTSETYDLDEVE